MQPRITTWTGNSVDEPTKKVITLGGGTKGQCWHWAVCTHTGGKRQAYSISSLDMGRLDGVQREIR